MAMTRVGEINDTIGCVEKDGANNSEGMGLVESRKAKRAARGGIVFNLPGGGGRRFQGRGIGGLAAIGEASGVGIVQSRVIVLDLALRGFGAHGRNGDTDGLDGGHFDLGGTEKGAATMEKGGAAAA